MTLPSHRDDVSGTTYYEVVFEAQLVRTLLGEQHGEPLRYTTHHRYNDFEELHAATHEALRLERSFKPPKYFFHGPQVKADRLVSLARALQDMLEAAATHGVPRALAEFVGLRASALAGGVGGAGPSQSAGAPLEGAKSGPSVEWHPSEEVQQARDGELGERGVLRVTLIRGRELVAADFNGKSDPFVKLGLGRHSHTSKVVPKSLDPEWNETFTFEGALLELVGEPLLLQCWDQDFGGLSKDDLGKVSVDLTTLLHKGRPAERWLVTAPLSSPDHGQKGFLELALTWEAQKGAAAAAAAAQTGEARAAGPAWTPCKEAAEGRDTELGASGVNLASEPEHSPSLSAPLPSLSERLPHMAGDPRALAAGRGAARGGQQPVFQGIVGPIRQAEPGRQGAQEQGDLEHAGPGVERELRVQGHAARAGVRAAAAAVLGLGHGWAVEGRAGRRVRRAGDADGEGSRYTMPPRCIVATQHAHGVLTHPCAHAVCSHVQARPNEFWELKVPLSKQGCLVIAASWGGFAGVPPRLCILRRRPGERVWCRCGRPAAPWAAGRGECPAL